MKINKVLLVAPPAFTFKGSRDINPLPPMGLGYLASILEGMGIEVKILDCLIHGWDHKEEVNENIIRVGLSDTEIEDQITSFSPDMVGVNCQFSRQYKIYHKIFSLAKKVNQNCIVLAGGAHTSVCPEEVLNDPNCDFVLIGEAEKSLENLVLALNRDAEFNQIDGLGWKYNGTVNINHKKNMISELDSIPFPAYHLMELDKYFGIDASHGIRHKDRFSPIITSRGCPAKCTFCSAHRVWGNLNRLRSVDNVIEEMKLLKNVYNIEELMFEDDNVSANPKRAKELFRRMIDEKFNFIWDTPNGIGAWSMDEEMIDLMKQSGCVKLNFPVESGSQRVLTNIIRKPLNLEKVKRLTEYCQKIGLDYSMFLVIGLPGEKKSEMWESYKFAGACKCYNPHISVATPYPGTKLYEECIAKGYFSRPFSLDDLFIRSFLIKTPEWNEDDLRKMLIYGDIYLKLKSVLDNPINAMKYLKKIIQKPTIFIYFFKRVFFKMRRY